MDLELNALLLDVFLFGINAHLGETLKHISDKTKKECGLFAGDFHNIMHCVKYR